MSPAETVSSGAALKPPRLSIRHFLIWMMVVGALLTIHRTAMEMPDILEGEWESAAQAKLLWRIRGISQLVATPFQGLAIVAGTLVIFNVIRRRSLFVDHPGHWLLVSIGGYFLIDESLSLCWSAIGSWLYRPPSFEELRAIRIWIIALDLIPALSAASLLSASVFSVRRPWRWRLVFVAAMTAAVLTVWAQLRVWQSPANGLEIQWFGWAAWWLLSAAMITLVMAVIWDWLAGLSRDWLHHAGVVCALAIAALSVVELIAIACLI